jgi:hypothetical protein
VPEPACNHVTQSVGTAWHITPWLLSPATMFKLVELVLENVMYNVPIQNAYPLLKVSKYEVRTVIPVPEENAQPMTGHNFTFV